MPEDMKETKAKKLAAARKKLKEYQRRGYEPSTTTPPLSITSECCSERSNSEINLDTSNETAPVAANPISTTVNYFEESANGGSIYQEEMTRRKSSPSPENEFSSTLGSPIENSYKQETTDHQLQQKQQQFNAMQLLINEKSQLTSELNRYRNLCREKDSELDEMRSQLSIVKSSLEEVQQSNKQFQQSHDQLRKMNAELMHKLSQSNAIQEDQGTCLTELNEQLKMMQNQAKEFEDKFRAKSKELELAQLRIQQISDENKTGKDNRVELLTQSQFMYEQQIRDLQAMVQQFSQDKEQSSAQYQNYVERLNAEMTSLTERNSELIDECTKFQERERQLIDHVSELEKEIQKNLSLRQGSINSQQQQQEENEPSDSSNENHTACQKRIEELQELANDFDFKRHEFQLKIKSQEDRLIELQHLLAEKEEELSTLTEHMAEQPDQVKLLAAMESDKVAASRALAQNVDLKKQLVEMEMRFVQLTNDKASLTHKLDAEEFANRDMRNNFSVMEAKLNQFEERFKYKDAEMIRLSHENEELIRENSTLKRLLEKRLSKEEPAILGHLHTEEREKIENEYEQCNHDHNHKNESNCNKYEKKEISSTPDELKEKMQYFKSDSCQEAYDTTEAKLTTTPNLPTTEAVEKLQARFTYLMSQIADLTEEKQRLEHLVLQLQGETETIGEYIALYQTQRRILKQREYEKAAQTRLLQEEREVLREKIAQLNFLVSRLGGFAEQSLHTIKLDEKNNEDMKLQVDNALAESISIEPYDHGDIENFNQMTEKDHVKRTETTIDSNESSNIKLPSAETSEILLKIQSIMSEIQENTSRNMAPSESPHKTADICHCCEGQLKVV